MIRIRLLDKAGERLGIDSPTCPVAALKHRTDQDELAGQPVRSRDESNGSPAAAGRL
jgi:hypothetical protein